MVDYQKGGEPTDEAIELVSQLIPSFVKESEEKAEVIKEIREEKKMQQEILAVELRQKTMSKIDADLNRLESEKVNRKNEDVSFGF